MTEKQYETALEALGCKNVTTNRQNKNGTTMFELPTGDNVAEFKSGYIRKYLMSGVEGYKFHSCYQLNPTYKTPYKMIWRDGKLHEGTHNRRMLIYNRAERLKRLVLYTIKQINKSK